MAPSTRLFLAALIFLLSCVTVFSEPATGDEAGSKPAVGEDTTEAKLKAAEDQIESYKLSMTEMQEELREEKAKAITANELRVTAEGALSDAVRNTLVSEASASNLAKDLAHQEVLAAKVQKELSEAQAATHASEAQERVQHDENTALKAKLEAAEARTHELERDIADQRGQVSELRKETTALRENEDKLLLVVDKIGKRDDSIQARLEALQEQEEKLTHELEIARHLAEDPDLTAYLSSRRKGLSPDLDGALNKTLEIVGPTVETAVILGGDAWSAANQRVNSTVTAVVGRRHAPAVSFVILCALLAVPMLLSSRVFQMLTRRLSKHALHVFLNVYLGAFFACAYIASFVVEQGEAMSALRRFDRRSYDYIHLIMALISLLYLYLTTSRARVFLAHPPPLPLSVPAPRSVGEKVVSWARYYGLVPLQCVCAWLVAAEYYRSIWTPAMLNREPLVARSEYLIFTVVFVWGFFIACSLRQQGNSPLLPFARSGFPDAKSS